MRRHDLLPPRRDARGARGPAAVRRRVLGRTGLAVSPVGFGAWAIGGNRLDRKSTRLNSSHLVISYAVFCLKKKKKTSRSLLPNTSLERYRSPLWPARLP